MEKVDWTKIKHFSPDEFDDPGQPGSHIYMNPRTIIMLGDLREKTGWPIVTHNKFGLRGCVCVERDGHSPSSLHYVPRSEDDPECSAVDFHFDIDVDPRDQAMRVLRAGFQGVGFYYDWKWPGRGVLPIGFHVDQRPRPQIWKRMGGTNYIYFLK